MASLGASLSLVAGAALSLLVISFVFAYDGLSGSDNDGAGVKAQVVVPELAATTARVRPTSARGDAVVIAAVPAARPAAERRPAPRKATIAAEVAVEVRQPADERAVVPPPAADPTTSGSGSQAPGAGDGVRELGDSVTSAIDDTGAAATDVTATLGPPVTATVQELVNLLNGLIEGATGGLAGALDTTLKR